MAPLHCPQCNSTKLFKDGFRRWDNGEKVQRWLCRDCAFRFSEKNVNRLSRKKSNQSFNNQSASLSNYRLSAILQEAKKMDRAAETKTVAGESPLDQQSPKGKLLQYQLWMQKEGYSDATTSGRAKLLRILTKRQANLYDPDTVKATIAKQPWSLGRKANAVDAYTSFLKMAGGQWQPPRYQGIRKIPFIPSENEIDQVISGCSSRIATFVQLLKETGARCGEAWQLKWTDLDTETRTIRITPEKRSNPRIAKLSAKLMDMLQAQPKIYGDRIFSKPNMPLDHFRDLFCQQRKRLAFKLQNPRLLRITFHTMRHWKGTMEYHKTKDILHVMQVLGHKNIKNTLIYVQLAEELFKDQQDYISKVAKTENDACLLIEAGFEFVCDFNGNKLFKKRKY